MADSESPFVSYAQNQEDVILWRAFKSVAQGSYVDIGAAHPVWESVTKAFYDRGWHGINIEPNPHFHEMLERERPRDINILALAGAQPGEKDLYIVGHSGLSTASEESRRLLDEHGHAVTSCIKSQVVRIKDILKDHCLGDIHFLKVDAEGMEVAALRGCSLDVNRPKIIIVESTIPETNCRRNDGLRDFMQSKGYMFTFFDGLNDYFIARECASLADAVSFPANPLDKYRTSIQVDLESRLANEPVNQQPLEVQGNNKEEFDKTPRRQTVFDRAARFLKRQWTAPSDDDVRWAYRVLLNRLPENSEVVNQHRKAHANLRELINTITSSKEYSASRHC
jgi:FkbM family methyltransferase